MLTCVNIFQEGDIPSEDINTSSGHSFNCIKVICKGQGQHIEGQTLTPVRLSNDRRQAYVSVLVKLFLMPLPYSSVIEHLTRDLVGLGLGLNLSQGFHYLSHLLQYDFMPCLNLSTFTIRQCLFYISDTDFIIYIHISLANELELLLSCLQKEIYECYTYFDWMLINFLCSDGFSLDDILHGYASLSLVRRSCYKNTGRRTDKGM